MVCAQYDCMAGDGEACSHIAYQLFTVEANTQMKHSFFAHLYHVQGYPGHSKMCHFLKYTS